MDSGPDRTDATDRAQSPSAWRRTRVVVFIGLAIIAGGLSGALVSGAMDGIGVATDQTSATSTPSATASPQERPNNQTTPRPSPTPPITPTPAATTAPATPEDAATCFTQAASATPGPIPSGSPEPNADLIARLPATVLGAMTDRSAFSGPWLVANGFYSGLVYGFAACTGADLDDVRIGMAHGPNTRGYAVMAVEIDSVQGDELRRLFLEDYLGALGSGEELTLEDRSHAGRQYTLMNEVAVLYVADATFYYITAYCCVDESRESPDPSATPRPTGMDIIHSMLEGLPPN